MELLSVLVEFVVEVTGMVVRLLVLWYLLAHMTEVICVLRQSCDRVSNVLLLWRVSCIDLLPCSGQRPA